MLKLRQLDLDPSSFSPNVEKKRFFFSFFSFPYQYAKSFSIDNNFHITAQKSEINHKQYKF